MFFFFFFSFEKKINDQYSTVPTHPYPIKTRERKEVKSSCLALRQGAMKVLKVFIYKKSKIHWANVLLVLNMFAKCYKNPTNRLGIIAEQRDKQTYRTNTKRRGKLNLKLTSAVQWTNNPVGRPWKKISKEKKTGWELRYHLVQK